MAGTSTSQQLVNLTGTSDEERILEANWISNFYTKFFGRRTSNFSRN